MSWLPQRVPGMRVNAGEHLILVDSGLPTDTFNVVCGARLNQRNVRERIAWVVNYFQTVARPFSWWVGPGDQPSYLGEALVSAGLEAAESETAMFADLNALNEVKPLPPGLRIERAQTPEQIRAFAAVVAANWMPPDTAVLDFYEAATPFLLRPDAPLRLYVGYWNGVPVASSELTIGGGRCRPVQRLHTRNASPSRNRGFYDPAPTPRRPRAGTQRGDFAGVRRGASAFIPDWVFNRPGSSPNTNFLR